MDWKPKPWLAALLGFFLPPIGMLYVTRPRWAMFYLLLPLAIMLYLFMQSREWFVYADWVNLGFAVAGAIQAFLIARAFQPTWQRPWYSRWYGLISAPLLFLLPWLALRTFVWEPFHFPGQSMLPTVKQGDLMLVQKWGCGNYQLFSLTILQTSLSANCQPQRGELFVFLYPEKQEISYLKRIIGLPGDAISYDGIQLTVNGAAATHIAPQGNYTVPGNDSAFSTLTETLDGRTYQVLSQEQVAARKTGEWQVPEGQYFVMGDNRDMSNDSRYWGFVPQENLVGKLIYQF